MLNKMNKFKKTGIFFISTVLHLIAGGIIYYFFRPIALWYWQQRPILGIDFYNLGSYVAYLARHFVWQFNGWKYIWWTGGPLSIDYPILHAYLVLPFLKAFSLVQAIQVYILGSLFLFLFFSYFLFAEISKDRVLAIILTLASAFSIALYGPLVLGGSLPYFTSQFFLPFVLWLLVKFLKSKDYRWFYLSSLFLGISFLGHPQVGFSYIIPISFLLLLAYPLEGEKYLSFGKIKRIFLYFIVAILAGYPQMGLYLGRTPRQIITTIPNQLSRILNVFIERSKGEGTLPTTGGKVVSGETAVEILKFNRGQLKHFITDTNELFFYFLGVAVAIFVFSFLIRRKRKNSLKAFVFVLPALWVIFYNYLYAYGISIFHGGWYRVFWPFPLALGILISFVWKDFWQAIKERLTILDKKFVLKTVLVVTSSIIVIFPGYYLLKQNSSEKMLKQMETPGLRQQSSAFPDSLNVYVEKEGLERLKGELTPSWLDPNETNYRLFEADQRVNLWWNALYDMPLVKGYVELPPGDASGASYWTSIALTRTAGNEDSLVKSWGVPPEVAYNNALFLIDWFSIKYIEAEHEKSDSYNPLTAYLAESSIFNKKEKVIIPGWIQLYNTEDGKIKFHPEEEEYLTYYEVRDELVSPIVHPTNASTIGVIGAYDAYNTFLRALAAINLNSRKVIPVEMGQFIDGVSYQNMKDMDAILLYAYDYRNHGSVWAKLEKYVQEGGKVIIETGSEVKQTGSVNLPGKYPRELPNIFPIKMTKKEDLGTDWQLTSTAKETEGVNLEEFGPPTIDGQPWIFSLPNSSESLREGARIILANKDTPLIVSWKYGEGEVVWSGMNLPYHINTHKNMEEGKLLNKILEHFIDLSPVSYSEYETKRKSANQIIVQGANAKGVIFRENSNPGWEAEVISNIKYKKLKIYKAGPTYHRFSYVRLPREAQDSFTITFSYKGEFWTYFWLFVWLATMVALLDRIIFNSRLVTPILKACVPLKKRVGKWWEKEEY